MGPISQLVRSLLASACDASPDRLHHLAVEDKVHLVATREATRSLELNLATSRLNRGHPTNGERIAGTQHLPLVLDLHHGKVLFRGSDTLFHALHLLLFKVIGTAQLDELGH